MEDNKKGKKGEFGSPQKVFDVTLNLQNAEDVRAKDRSKINVLFNGQRPYTKDEEEKHQIQINVNWGEGKRIMLDANRQVNNALLHPGLLFNCALEAGQVDKRDAWSIDFTKFIHMPLQRGMSGRLYNSLTRNRNASLCMHGIGPMVWMKQGFWRPRYIPLEDLLIPTDTFCDLSNLRYFAVNLYLTPGEFVDMTQGDTVKPGWNQKQIRAILDWQKKNYTESTPSTWRDQPEAMREVIQQNKGYYYSDAIPKIRLRAFFWQDCDDPDKWYRNIIQRETYGESKITEFVYDGKDEVMATEVYRLLNVTYGDVSLIAPLKYHSVRGLGVDLYAPVETSNRLRCEFVQAVFEQLKMYFRIKDPADRERLKKVVLEAYGFIPEGLDILKREERHQFDPNVVQMAVSQIKETMQENSASFVKDRDDGGQKEMTAFEANARLNQANVMVNSMLQNIYLQEGYIYEEIVRRFCEKDSPDPQVKEFQERCKKAGIPDDLMVAENWRVSPERVLGGGDRTLAQAQAGWLNQNKTQFPPESQQKILRIVTGTMLDDPSKAAMLVPAAPVLSTAGTVAAENVFGALMHGVQVQLRSGIDQIGYIETLLKFMGSIIQRISSTDNVGTMDDLIGLATTAHDITQHISILAADDREKQRVKQYSDALGQMMNLIKAFGQRQSQAKEAQQNQSQPDPKAQAQAQATVMTAQLKAQITAQKAQQKQQERMLEFKLDMAREDLRTMSEIRREDLHHKQQMINESMDAALESMRQLRQMRATPAGGEE